MELLKELKQKEIDSIIDVAYKVDEIPAREQQNLYRQGELTKEMISFAKDANPYFPETLRKRVEKKVENKYSTIQEKVKDKVGAIKKIEQFANGYNIEGENGITTLEIITAGGYNIQCLHHRILIK